MTATLRPDEAQRLETLRQYDILDTPAELVFDDLTELAAQICQTPIAMISLVDDKRQWFKSAVGVSVKETPRDMAFCAHTILHTDRVMQIQDALKDERFRDNALVTSDPHVRFYAGAPLVAREGLPLGALCVIDHQPRTLTPEQLSALQTLGRHVVSQLELRRSAVELTREIAERKRIEAQLREQNEHLVQSKKEQSSMLELDEKSRGVLLSVLEDAVCSRERSELALGELKHEMTERKQAELSLRESEERFRQLAENIDEVFWIANPIDGKILYVSSAFEKIWGMPCKSLYKTRQVWLDTIHRDDREQVLLAITTKQNRGEYDETYRIVRPDGLVRWIHDRAFPIRNAAGEVFRVVGTASDVTENRNLESQFLQSQKMEAFGLLAGGVAHDFNNLMSVVMGYSDIWLLKLPLDSPVRIPLKAIKNAGERASSLTKQLLAFSRQTVLESKVLDLNTVVRETEKMLGRLIGDDIVLSSILNPAIPRIKVDPGQIGQVLMNLAINARDAMPHGGNLTIETRTVNFDDAYVQAHLGTKPGSHVMLSVSDTGSGMPPEIVARIFEPFFTTKGVGKGTGLGLAVVYGVISQSGGSIDVESNLGTGTTFKLYFPVTLENVNSASKSGEIEVHAGIETILVVEDESSLLEIVKESLESFGYTVLTASSGPDALKLVCANEGTIDLMLTDVVMPGMSGRELADTLKQKLPELKVVFMSGYTDDSVVRHGVNHEQVAFLQKPFAPFDLVKKVREELDKNSSVPALQIP